MEFDKSFNFVLMILFVIESGFYFVKVCGGGFVVVKNEGFFVECKGMLNIFYLFCNAIFFDLYGVEEKIKFDYVDKFDFKGV